MFEIFTASLLLSLIHVLVPHHWLPVSLLAKSEKWNKRQTLLAAFITSASHVISTIILGVFIGIIGKNADHNMQDFTHWFSPLLMVIFGILYISLGHEHTHQSIDQYHSKNYSKIVTSLCITLLFSPCLEIEPIFFSAGALGVNGILLVAFVYAFVSILGTCIFAIGGAKTIKKFDFHFLEHHEKKITGVILIIIGLFSYFVEI